MLSAPSGNRASRPSSPMAVTKVATRTSTSVAAGRRAVMVTGPLLARSQSGGPAVAGELEVVAVQVARVHGVGSDEPGAAVDGDERRVAVERAVQRRVAHPQHVLVLARAAADQAAVGREQDVDVP